MIDNSANIPAWFLSDDNRVSLYSSVRSVRNFRSINFPDNADAGAIRQVGRITEAVLESLIGDGNVKRTDLANAEQAEIARLQKFRILPKRPYEILKRMKLYHYTKTDCYLLINYSDHLTFFAHSGGKEIEDAYSRCSRFMSLFDKKEFAADIKGNYLTSSLDYFGSGLKCFSVITVPSIKLFGDTDKLFSSLTANGISYAGYFSQDINESAIITGKISVSKSPDDIVNNFGKIIGELDKICSDIVKNNLNVKDKLWTKCEKIFNYDFLAFKDFMEIYYILSFAADAGYNGVSVRELNGQLAGLIESLPQTEPESRINGEFREWMKVKAEKLLKKE